MEQAEALQEDYSEAPVEQQYVDTDDSEVEETIDAEDDTELEAEESEAEDEIQYEEVDYEGNTYKLPPELKSALLRQADYTQKTQEVANQRKALEDRAYQIQQAAEMQQRNMQGYAQLAALQNQLSEYSNVDWNQFSEQSPQEAQQAFFQYSQLKDATANLSTQLEKQQQQALQQQRAIHAKRLEQGQAELQRDIPGWNTDMAKSIVEHGKTYRFSDNELAQIADPRMVKVLHDAMMYRKSLDKATEKPSKQAKPISKVKSKATATKDPNKMTTDEWLKWRNKQLSKE